MDFDLEISEVALHDPMLEEAFSAIQAFSPASTIRTTGTLQESVGVPEWLILTSTVVQITGGLQPTWLGVQALGRFLANLRRRYPKAPQPKLRIKDGRTNSSLALDGADSETMSKAIQQWLGAYGPNQPNSKK